MSHQAPNSPKSHSPRVKRDRGFSPLWILPLLTLALAGWFVTKAIQDSGQRIQIQFEDAQGLIAGRTTIRYQGLEIGMVRNINLTSDLSAIYVDADIYPKATKLLGKDTQFWLVKPTASLSGISGLDALVSGNYISILPASAPDGHSTFKALVEPPSDAQLRDGLNLTLIAQDLGAVNIGSKILYKKIPIGEVYSYELDKHTKNIKLGTVIYPKYQHLINTNSRFWNVSGISAKLGADGIDIRMESLLALLNGAIAVDLPEGGEEIASPHQFKLYPDLQKAGRGISITIELPENHGIASRGSAIFYKGIEVGIVNDVSLTEDRSSIIATATIEPVFSDLLTTETKFAIEEATVSLTKLENVANIIRGNHLSLVAGDGEQTRHFSALRQNELHLSQNHVRLLTLNSQHSYGLTSGSPLLYKGMKVGHVHSLELIENQVEIQVLVDNKFSHLIKDNNRYFMKQAANASLVQGELNLSIAPVNELLHGAISFVVQGKPTEQSHFTLYQNEKLAKLANYRQAGYSKIQLVTDNIAGISEGSALLYRNLIVGHVTAYKLSRHGVVISALVDNQYAHLLTKDTVFWNYSGLQVNANVSGIEVNAAPLSKLLNGAIAFDSLPGIENKKGRYWKLYDDFNDAKNFGKTIELTSAFANNLNVGTQIKYQSVTVGEVIALTPDFNHQHIVYTARIYPHFADKLTVEDSQFMVRNAKISLSEIKDLSSAIIATIDVIPGKSHVQGKGRFSLDSHKEEIQYVEYTLQTSHRGSVNVGAPIHFRNMPVGKVSDIELGQLSDRVIITIQIAMDYQYLVRENSLFWNQSGVDVSIGLSGASIRAGTIDSLIKGGIAFATPEQAELLPIAQSGSTFFLHAKAEESWNEWRTIIPKPEE